MNEIAWLFFAVVALSSVLAVVLPAPSDHRYSLPPAPPSNLDDEGFCKQCGMPRYKAGSLSHVTGHV